MRTLDDVPVELDHALREAVLARAGKYGGAVKSIRRARDHDGDECIDVEIVYSMPDKPVDPINIIGLDGILRDIAYAHGERGIVYVRNHFPHNQVIQATRSGFWLGDAPRGSPS
ncbi:MAG: hypothetical protein IT556_09305 [Acetobacteraceae bacterium]|nr:hypothetical protein [Acetobacteraceae bacterium]